MNTNRQDLRALAAADREARIGMAIGDVIGDLVNWLAERVSGHHDHTLPGTPTRRPH
ncbi:MAG TPA: hypothetical protein VED40_16860 [Azospirillaceae bacterium]|nr:hypothetical protein [Azospirillaceae bacterium]